MEKALSVDSFAIVPLRIDAADDVHFFGTTWARRVPLTRGPGQDKGPSGGGSTWKCRRCRGTNPIRCSKGSSCISRMCAPIGKRRTAGTSRRIAVPPDSAHGSAIRVEIARNVRSRSSGRRRTTGAMRSGGQACKAMRLFLFLREDDMIPMIVASAADFAPEREEVLRLVANGLPVLWGDDADPGWSRPRSQGNPTAKPSSTWAGSSRRKNSRTRRRSDKP